MIIFEFQEASLEIFIIFSSRYAWSSHRHPLAYPNPLVCLILLLWYNQWSSRSISDDICVFFDFLSVRIIRTELLRCILDQQSSHSDPWPTQLWLGDIIDIYENDWLYLEMLDALALGDFRLRKDRTIRNVHLRTYFESGRCMKASWCSRISECQSVQYFKDTHQTCS